KVCPGSLPKPRSIARWIFSLGILTDLASSIAIRRRGLDSGSLELPDLAAIAIALPSLVKVWPRLASLAPLARLMVAHLECPDISRNYTTNLNLNKCQGLPSRQVWGVLRIRAAGRLLGKLVNNSSLLLCKTNPTTGKLGVILNR